jgi:hypothetical protein
MAKSKTVLFLGLGAVHQGWPQFRNFAGDVWTLNDWYAFQGPYVACKQPQRVYNIHSDFIEKEQEILSRGRFANWREAYDRSGAEIVCQCDLGVKNQRMFDMAEAEKWFPDPLFWCSSWSYMFADAIREGYNEIRMERISLFGSDEYRRQAYGTLLCIDEARRSGIKVSWPWERVVKDDSTQLTVAEMGTVQDVNFRYGTDRQRTVKIDTSKLQIPVLPDAEDVSVWL